MRIFEGFPGSGRQITVGLSTTAIFSPFGGYFLGNFTDKASIIIQRYDGVPRRLFIDPRMHDLE